MNPYKVTEGVSVVRQSDGVTIPADPANVDYQEFLAWQAQGNTPDPVDEPVIPPPAPDFVGFLSLLIASPFYQKILQQAVAFPIVNVMLTTAMGALILAAAGQPNTAGIQSGVSALLASMTLEAEDIEALQEMLTASHLNALIQLPTL
jgi:hypothetical protein